MMSKKIRPGMSNHGWSPTTRGRLTPFGVSRTAGRAAAAGAYAAAAVDCAGLSSPAAARLDPAARRSAVAACALPRSIASGCLPLGFRATKPAASPLDQLRAKLPPLVYRHPGLIRCASPAAFAQWLQPAEIRDLSRGGVAGQVVERRGRTPHTSHERGRIAFLGKLRRTGRTTEQIRAGPPGFRRAIADLQDAEGRAGHRAPARLSACQSCKVRLSAYSERRQHVGAKLGGNRRAWITVRMRP